MTDSLRKFGPIAVVLLLVVAGAVWMLSGDSNAKTITAYFPRTVSLYEGSDVRVLGVAIGQVESIEPEGTLVKVTMTYDGEVKIPESASAVVVAPSVVGDRYIQLTPAYKEGKALPDNAVLKDNRTAIPLELDEIYDSLDELTVALGPNGANKDGALTDLLEQTAANFGGQGAAFKQTIEDFGELSSTLDDNKDELFGSARKLHAFIETLAENDSTVRDFNQSLGNVSEMLDGEREELTSALHHLGIALDQVGTFVRDNREVLGTTISDLDRLFRLLARRKNEISRTLAIAPLALDNLAMAYNPQAGTLDSNANLGELVGGLTSDPATVLCSLVSAEDPNGAICDLINTLPLPRNAPFMAGSGSWSDDRYDPTLNGLVVND